MVKSLLIVNVVVYLIGIFGFSQISYYMALFPFDSEYFRPYQLFTYMFAHGGFGHILFNMIGLVVFGSLLEQFWGPNRLLSFYLITGIGAALLYGGATYFGLFGQTGGSMLGASGAIYGLLMAAAMLFPNTQMMLLFPPIPIKLKWLAIIFGGLALYNSVMYDPADRTAHLAHLGGMIFAFIMIKIWQKKGKDFY